MFRNRRTSGITVAQWPNISLTAFIILSIMLRTLHPHGSTDAVLHVIADVSILVWAVDELIRGVNPFRRILGSLVLLAMIADVIISQA